ncbi:MAG: metal ABC transporter ATP-binding protein [Thermoanaerobaculales bacterium]|nr:metal ABC transporter ATP-binding protein [Thermoanaerobaculales bacterium]
MKPETPAPVIKVENLGFRFDGGPPVLEDVNLEIAAGDFASVIGPNGGGKTTLVKLIVGLLSPTAGEVRVFGVSPIKARPRIGYMPQHAMMDPRFPVRAIDVVLMGRLGIGRRFGNYSRADREAAAEALATVDLEDLGSRPFSNLSGGQRQRVLLARALVTDPEILLLDEPAAGLDQKVEQDFFELLKELNRRLTIILVTHDLGFVAGFVRTVICVHGHVDIHPTSALDGRAISDIYGGEVRMVRHDHRVDH